METTGRIPCKLPGGGMDVNNSIGASRTHGGQNGGQPEHCRVIVRNIVVVFSGWNLLNETDEKNCRNAEQNIDRNVDKNI